MNPLEQGASNVNVLALGLLILACFVVAGSSAQNGIKALFLTAAIVPMGQRFMLAGLHLYFFRILLFVGLCRVISRGEFREFQWNKIDKLYVLGAFVFFVCGLIRGSVAPIYGDIYNTLVPYFVFRCLTKNFEDMLGSLRFLALLALLVSLPMIHEAVTHHNFFSVFGGVPFVDDLRDGKARCQGAFMHPVMAGAFGASIFPLAVGLWFEGGRNKRFSVMGVIGALIIIFTAVSSGAIIALAAGIVGFALWPLRNKMSLFRRGMVLTVIGLAISMKAPVWFLISKVSDVVGGGGWYRSYIIDQFFTHFTQWCWIGTDYTANWSFAGYVLKVDPNNMDITNHYVQQGIRGGLLGLCLFIAVQVQCFKVIGRLVHSESIILRHRMLAWAIGVTMVAYCAAFISEALFDQTQVFLIWLFATISCLSARGLIPELEDHSDANPTVEDLAATSTP